MKLINRIKVILFIDEDKKLYGEYFNKVLLPVDIGVTDNLVGSKRKDVSIESISDADIGIDWPIPEGEQPLLSEKDASAGKFESVIGIFS